MMRNNHKFLKHSLWFITSYLPLYIFLFILNWKAFYEGIFEIKNMVAFMMLLTACIISLLTIYAISKISDGSYFTINSTIHKNDDSLMNYIFTYIVPICSSNITATIENLIVNILLFF
jgi:hypothetical protein